MKLFAAGGRKLTDDVEAALEAELRPPARRTSDAAAADRRRRRQRRGRHRRRRPAGPTSVRGSIEGRSLDGLRVVVDCANGAATRSRRRSCARSGADVEVIHDEPDGTNINAGCGSTHPEDLQRAVVAARCRRRPRLRRRRRPGAGGRRRPAALIDGDQIIGDLRRSTATTAAGSPTTPSSSP